MFSCNLIASKSFTQDHKSSSLSSNTNSQQGKARHKKNKGKPLQESSNTTAAAAANINNFQDTGLEASGGMCNGEMTDVELDIMQTTGCQVRLGVVIHKPSATSHSDV